MAVTMVGRDGEKTVLRGASGQAFESTVPAGLAAGDKAIVASPESVRLSPGTSPVDAVNTISGDVLRTVFKGPTLSVWLDAPGCEFVCSLPIETIGAAPPRPGEIWSAGWSPERTLIMREQ